MAKFALWGLLIVGVFVWVGLLAASVPAFSPLIAAWSSWVGSLPPIFPALAGLTIAAGFVLLKDAHRRPSPFAQEPTRGLVQLGVVVLITALIALCCLALLTHQLKPMNATLMVIFGGLTLIVGAHAVDSLRGDEGFFIESHWGGLGGGLGGWRVAPTGVLIVLLLLLVGVTLVASGAVLDGASKVANQSGKAVEPAAKNPNPRSASPAGAQGHGQ